jgi:hypothetical protein
MQSVTIKAIDNNDFDIWLPLWKGYRRFYEVDIPFPVTLKTWARFLDSAGPMHAALAMVREQALGLVHSIYQSIHLGDGRLLLSSGPVCCGRCAWQRHRPRADQACRCGYFPIPTTPNKSADALIIENKLGTRAPDTYVAHERQCAVIKDEPLIIDPGQPRQHDFRLADGSSTRRSSPHPLRRRLPTARIFNDRTILAVAGIGVERLERVTPVTRGSTLGLIAHGGDDKVNRSVK